MSHLNTVIGNSIVAVIGSEEEQTFNQCSTCGSLDELVQIVVSDLSAPQLPHESLSTEFRILSSIRYVSRMCLHHRTFLLSAEIH